MVDEKEIDAFLEHYGIRGMKWGVSKQQAGRAAKAVGKGSVVVGKVAGRGIKKAAIYSKDHPKNAAKIAAGAAFAGLLLSRKISNIRSAKSTSQGEKVAAKILGSKAKDLVFSAKGPGFEVQAARGMTTATINALVKSARRGL